jgi:hypothetical protein
MSTGLPTWEWDVYSTTHDLLQQGVTEATHSRVEVVAKGQPMSAKAWKAIADVLKVEPNDLLTEALAP